jgi:hypothetical protein
VLGLWRTDADQAHLFSGAELQGVAINDAFDPNGMKLSSNLLPYQGFACLSA